MKKEQKEKVIEAACDLIEAGQYVPGRFRVQDDAKVLTAPDANWVQAWISVPLNVGKS